MPKSLSFYTTYVALLALATATSFVVADEQAAIIERDAINLTIPNPFGSTPIFETNNQNGRLIGLHIPFLLDFELHFRGALSQTKFDFALLKGLIGLTYDKMPGLDGQNHGPVKVKLLYMNAFNNKESPMPSMPAIPI